VVGRRGGGVAGQQPWLGAADKITRRQM